MADDTFKNTIYVIIVEREDNVQNNPMMSGGCWVAKVPQLKKPPPPGSGAPERCGAIGDTLEHALEAIAKAIALSERD